MEPQLVRTSTVLTICQNYIPGTHAAWVYVTNNTPRLSNSEILFKD